MSATQKFFRKLFGQDGDRAAVPDTTAGDGSISYQNGYGFDYERASTDGLKKNIERTKLNQVLYDMTLAAQQYQTMGFPEYIAAADNGGAAYPYARNAHVRWTDGNVYISQVDANTSDPSDATKWQITGIGVGAIAYFPATTAPSGYVKANGALLSRTTYATLWAFAQASGNLAVSDGAWAKGQFSPGDGATNFRIPDLRGYTLRAWDDSSGVDAGRVLGSVQADQLLAHSHGLTDPGHGHGSTVTDPGHGHGLTDPGHAHGTTDPTHGHVVSDPTHSHGIQHDVLSDSSGVGMSGSGRAGDQVWSTQAAATGIGIVPSATGVSVNAGASNVSVNAGASNVSVTVGNAASGLTVQASAGGTEVRVKSIAELACIRYR